MERQLALDLLTVTVHCFTCPHAVHGADPMAAHDEMERHYASAHRTLIARLVGELS